MGIRLYVGNLPFNVTEAELREHFSTIGTLSYLSIPKDRETGKQRGFVFVEYKARARAEEPIRQFNNQWLRGGPLWVSEARAKNETRRGAPAPPPLPPPPSTGGTDPADPP